MNKNIHSDIHKEKSQKPTIDRVDK